MSDEYLKYEALLGRNRHEQEELRKRIRGLVLSLRQLIDPTLAAENLKSELISAQALDLFKMQTALWELQEQAAVIKEALGRG